jgi:Domain of unknown function (DUF4124)
MRLTLRSFFVLVFGGLLGLPVASIALAQGELYTCKDDNGRVITSDRPIQECAKRDIRILRSDGIQKGVLAAPLTEAQRKQRDLDEEAARLRANAERASAGSTKSKSKSKRPNKESLLNFPI